MWMGQPFQIQFCPLRIAIPVASSWLKTRKLKSKRVFVPLPTYSWLKRSEIGTVIFAHHKKAVISTANFM